MAFPAQLQPGDCEDGASVGIGEVNSVLLPIVHQAQSNWWASEGEERDT